MGYESPIRASIEPNTEALEFGKYFFDAHSSSPSSEFFSPLEPALEIVTNLPILPRSHSGGSAACSDEVLSLVDVGGVGGFSDSTAKSNAFAVPTSFKGARAMPMRLAHEFFLSSE